MRSRAALIFLLAVPLMLAIAAAVVLSAPRLAPVGSITTVPKSDRLPVAIACRSA